MIKIKKLLPSEAMRFKVIRLRSLLENPDAFGTRFETASNWDEANWISQIQKMNTFIATIEEKDIGVVRLVKDELNPETAWIISMWVAPEARGRAVGSQLLQFVIEFAKEESFKNLKLDVVDSNQAAILLYERYGFSKNGIISNFPAPREHISEHQRELKLI